MIPRSHTHPPDHRQLDRLWWLWQGRDVSKRVREYQAVMKDGSQGVVSLQDEVEVTGLGSPLTTHEVMDTEAGILCYRY